MARYTLERINQKIALWEAADDAVSKRQAYTIGGRQLTSVDAEFIEEKLDKLYAEKDRIVNNTGRMVVRVGRVAR